jgi:ABC-type glycerol-3-phosphate transport system substrate-binding protein
MTAIDRDIPVPVYYQLKQLLKEQIQNGDLPPGGKIPTEEELCARYNLSRTPVRQALKELVVEGLLTRSPGRGTFVAQPSSSDAPTSITLRVVISDERWREPLIQAAVLWNQNHPQSQIDLDFTLMALDELRPYLIEAVGRGQAPDISLLDSVWVAEFASRYYLRPQFEIDPDWCSENEDDFFPALLAANQYNNILHGVPITADVSVIWYRRDWLDAEGLAPPTTWDELLAVGHHFKQPSVRTRYGLGAHPLVLVGGRRGGETTTYQLLPFLWSAGGDLIADDQVVLDSSHSQRALTFLTSLVQTEKLAPPEVVDYAWDEAARIFAKGEAALAVGGTYESFFIRSVADWDETVFQEKVGFVPIPAPAGGQSATLVGGMSYVIYRQSQTAGQALALLDLAGQDEILGPFSLRTAHHPPRIATAHNLAQAGNGFLGQTASLLKIARARPSIPDFARVSEQFQTLVEDCLTGRRAVTQAVPRTAEMIAAITGLPLA